MADIRVAVMTAQTALAGDPSVGSLITDGWFGKATQAAYDKASAKTREIVNTIFKAYGTDVETVRKSNVIAKSTSKELGPAWWPAEKVFAIVQRASARLGMEKYAEILKDFVLLEASNVVKDGVRYVKTDSRNGSFRGIMQMGSPAWVDAMRLLVKEGVYPSPGRSYGDYAMDAETNIFAGVAYAKINAESLLKSGYPITIGTLYAAHNQGAAGAKSYFKTGRLLWPDQSAKALTVMARGREQAIRTA